VPAAVKTDRNAAEHSLARNQHLVPRIRRKRRRNETIGLVGQVAL
jgi:hypothetical protein